MPVSPVRIRSHLGASVTFTMPFTFSVAKYADMIYVYGFCDGNSVHAVAEYQQRFPNHRIPTRRVFTRVYQTLRDTGTLPGVRIAAERDVNPYPTAFPYGNGMVLHFYQQQESSTTKTVHKVINKGLKAYV